MSICHSVAVGAYAVLCAAVAVGCISEGSRQAAGAGVTLFEGARVIVGDSSAAIENAAFLVENHRFTKVGRAGEWSRRSTPQADTI